MSLELKGETLAKAFLALCAQQGLTAPGREVRFAPPRRWRFDYAWADAKVALEVEGGIFTRGRHSRGAGMLKDMEKYNTAMTLGWRIIRVPPSNLCTLQTIDWLRDTMRNAA